MMRFSVLGAGGWGTAFARLLALSGHSVTLWARDPEKARVLARERENKPYLPGVSLPRENLEVTSELPRTADADAIVLAVPSFAVAEIADRFRPFVRPGHLFINLAKGLDRGSGHTMSEVIAERIPGRPVFTLSGPSHAEEVGRDMPTAVVLAGADLELGKRLQREISTPRFRVYVSADIRGVELCGTVKNIIAIAVGIGDGLGYGDNTRGALISRGLAEMVRFGRAFGGKERTFFGLAGLGDLVATATSPHSRNRYVGYRLGKGEPIERIMDGMAMVAEGVYATDVVHQLAGETGIDMPITDAVWRLLHGKSDPIALVNEIMSRPPKEERIG